MKTTQIEKRISELLQIQAKEVENDFANGDLWNKTEDKISCLKRYGQENYPDPIFDQEGLEIGYRLNNGEEIFWHGMSTYDVSQY